jgi:ATP adenylyltransferase
MNRLWSPWREKYILSLREESKDGCVFCHLKDLEPALENLVLYKGKLNYIVMNKFPYNNGHLLIVPYNHFSDITDLNGEESKEMM